MGGKLRVLDLFSGISGFTLGLDRAGGFETVRFIEKDPYCRRLLAARHPGVPCDPDVTTADFEEGEADVIVGGFPCQDLSNAGRGAGLAGSRSGLYRELVRAIRVVRPLYAIVENVAALLGRGMGVVLGDLAESGYDAAWDCIPASAVGAPHQRDRVWIVAHPGGEQHEGKGDAVWGQAAAGLPEAFERNTGLRSLGEEMADAASVRRREGHANCGGRGPRSGEEQGARSSGGGWWATEPDVGRVAHGVPARVDRLRALGNAVVPQIPELIGRAILSTLKEAA